jgi:tyrosyl-tRNA synthetase
MISEELALLPNENFLAEFIGRGYLYQSTNLEKLGEIFATKKIVAYIGFDCTAPSLHVGNLMQIMILKLLQKYGHKPIVIIGDATTTIGDPTGKSEARKILSLSEIDRNIVGIQKSLAKFLKFGNGKSDALLLKNSQWLGSICYLDFLRDYGRYISVNKMIGIETAKARLDNNQHLSFLEFNYMLIQGYDFCHLSQNYDCILQIGGSDQWGNIIMGIEAAHKVLGKELFGITTPLLTTANGSKMGKSIDGAVWINEDLLSPYHYYQFWRNTDDRDVVKFAKLYSEFTLDQMMQFQDLAKDDINKAKEQLAFCLTQLCHGQENAKKALSIARALFEEGGLDVNMPTFEVLQQDISCGINVNQLLKNSGLASSNSEGKRFVRGRSVSINDVRVEDENLVVNLQHFKDGNLKLSSSSKKHILIKLK